MSFPSSRPARRGSRFALPALRLLACCALGVLPARVGGAQVVVVDDGSFALFRGEERLGREDFSIRLARSAGGSAFVAQGTQLVGEQRTAVALTTDTTFAPVRFQLDRRDGTQLLESYNGALARGIWSGRSVRAEGESAREIRFQGPRILLEGTIIHQLWFVVRAAETGAVTVFVPRTLAEPRIRVTEGAPERVLIGAREIPARRWELRVGDGGPVRWEVWTDAAGRLLRVRDADTGIEARRDEPPR